MAKGDAGGVKTSSGTGVPKQDQYSVMHAIMDNLSGGGAQLGNSMAPSQVPSQPDNSGSLDSGTIGAIGNTIGGMTPPPSNINYGPNPNVGGGRFRPTNTGFGNLGNIGTQLGNMGMGMTPTNPQDMIRRTMMGKGTYGQ